MRAVRFHTHGGLDVLQVDDIDVPEPQADEVLVEVAAAGVNPVDTYFRDGSYTPFAMPMIPGVDVAGEVAAVGSGVTGFEVGDPVVGTGIGKATTAATPSSRRSRPTVSQSFPTKRTSSRRAARESRASPRGGRSSTTVGCNSARQS